MLFGGPKHLFLWEYTGFAGGSAVKNRLPMQELQVRSLVQEDLPEKEMATHSTILAWEIPWTKDHAGLHSCKESDTT